MVQLNLNFTDTCGYTRTHFTQVKFYNVECIFFVAHGLVMCTRAIKQLWHTIRTHLFSVLTHVRICQARVHANEAHEMCGENTRACANQNARVVCANQNARVKIVQDACCSCKP